MDPYPLRVSPGAQVKYQIERRLVGEMACRDSLIQSLNSLDQLGLKPLEFVADDVGGNALSASNSDDNRSLPHLAAKPAHPRGICRQREIKPLHDLLVPISHDRQAWRFSRRCMVPGSLCRRLQVLLKL